MDELVFLQGNLDNFNNIATKKDNTFYLVKCGDGSIRLYLGKVLLAKSDIISDFSYMLTDYYKKDEVDKLLNDKITTVLNEPI